MLTRLRIKNFKTLDDVDIELGPSVVFIGPNNSGKTSALQALTLWASGLSEWYARRKDSTAQKNVRVTLNRLSLVNTPVFEARELWNKRRVHTATKNSTTTKQSSVKIEIIVDGETDGLAWACPLEFQFANSEAIYCRPLRTKDEKAITAIPAGALSAKFALLPPMSGLSSNEAEIQPGRIQTLIGEGRTAEVLRNLCLAVSRNNPHGWKDIVTRMRKMFGVELSDPACDQIRGIVEMSYVDTRRNTRLDLASAGRGQLQTLLLLAYLYANPGSTLLLDEPDAHLELLRQRQIYDAISDVAQNTGSQIIAASHSEVILQEAAQRDIVIAFVGQPHRIDDRGSQLMKWLKTIPFDQYYLASLRKFVLYLEGATDLEFLRAFAEILDHPAKDILVDAFVHYVANSAQKAREHYFGLKDAERQLKGYALFDRLEPTPESGGGLAIQSWRKREIENYICKKEVLLRFAYDPSGNEEDNLVLRAQGHKRVHAMEQAISEIEAALLTLGKDPWSPDLKVSDEFLTPLFANFYKKLSLPNTMLKTNFHRIAAVVRPEELEDEISAVLSAMLAASENHNYM